MTTAQIDAIARVCHEANRGYQAGYPAEGIPLAPWWDVFGEEQRAGVREGVRLAIKGATPEELHESWCARKLAQGWVHGPVKSEEALTHPCLLPYDELPEAQRVKDRLFNAIVAVLA